MLYIVVYCSINIIVCSAYNSMWKQTVIIKEKLPNGYLKKYHPKYLSIESTVCRNSCWLRTLTPTRDSPTNTKVPPHVKTCGNTCIDFQVSTPKSTLKSVCIWTTDSSVSCVTPTLKYVF